MDDRETNGRDTMYGKRRIVLKSNGLVVICGKRPGGTGGGYAGIGRWYSTDGGYAADLISEDQKYSNIKLKDCAHKLAAQTSSKKPLCDAIWTFAHEFNIA